MGRYIIALKADKIKGTKVLYYMSGGLFLWWSIGVLALTFNAPFNSLLEANGCVRAAQSMSRNCS